MLVRESRTEVLTLTLTRREKDTLQQMAQEHGATMRGIVRKLIRDAARSDTSSTQSQEARHAS